MAGLRIVGKAGGQHENDRFPAAKRGSSPRVLIPVIVALARVALLHFVHLQGPHEDARLGRLLQQAIVNIREDRKGGAPGVAEPHSDPVAPRTGSAGRLQARMSRPQGLLGVPWPETKAFSTKWHFSVGIFERRLAVGNDCW